MTPVRAAKQGPIYQRQTYYLFEDGSNWCADDAQAFAVLTSAQKVMRDHGPGLKVEAHRPGDECPG